MGGAGPKPGAEQPLWMGNSATNSTPNEKPQRKAPQRAGLGTGTPGNTPFCPGVPADTRRKEPQNPVQSEDRRW